MTGGRVDGVQYAHRVNAAADLLDGGASAIDAADALATRFRVSARQARRYVDRAASTGRLAVLEPNVVFTVKLPASLAARIRARAAHSGVTLSALVGEALTEFLTPGRRRGQRG
jgi:hypothetical protein